eukprot:6223321-Pyramimonas_sp.AAC.1
MRVHNYDGSRCSSPRKGVPVRFRTIQDATETLIRGAGIPRTMCWHASRFSAVLSSTDAIP